MNIKVNISHNKNEVIYVSKVLIIIGSRREGNSWNLANKLKEELKKDRIISKVITPGNQKIYLCTGCMDCDETGVCDFNDDMQDNIKNVLESDILIFITPTRWNTLSGDLKIFMDRLNPLYTKESLKNKKMISISIGAKGKEDYSTDGAISALGSFADSAKMKVILTHQFNHCLESDDILKNEEEIEKLVSEIKKKIK